MKNAAWLTLIFAFSFLLFITGCCTKLKTSTTEQDITKHYYIEHLKRSTIALQYKKSDGWRIYCSGVAISKHKFLTAAHCTNPHDIQEIDEDPQKAVGTILKYRVYGETGGEHKWPDVSRTTPHTLIVAAIDSTEDLALLVSVDEAEHESAALKLADIWDGQEVSILGHSSALAWSYIPARVATSRIMKFDSDKHSHHMLHVWSFAHGGSSGGGVFDSEGNLLGIASFMLTGAPGAIFYTHRDEVCRFLTENQVVLD